MRGSLAIRQYTTEAAAAAAAVRQYKMEGTAAAVAASAAGGDVHMESVQETIPGRGSAECGGGGDCSTLRLGADPTALRVLIGTSAEAWRRMPEEERAARVQEQEGRPYRAGLYREGGAEGTIKLALLQPV